MVTTSENVVSFTGIVIAIGLISGLIYWIISLCKKKPYNWKKTILFALIVIAIIDFLLLFIATLFYLIIEKFPNWMPPDVIKMALFASIFITLDFISRNYKDIAKPLKKKKK